MYIPAVLYIHTIDTVPVDEYAEISYELLSDPVFTDNYIETAVKVQHVTEKY